MSEKYSDSEIEVTDGNTSFPVLREYIEQLDPGLKDKDRFIYAEDEED